LTTNSHDTEIRKLLRVDLLIIDLCRAGDYADWRVGCGHRRTGGPIELASDSLGR